MVNPLLHVNLQKLKRINGNA